MKKRSGYFFIPSEEDTPLEESCFYYIGKKDEFDTEHYPISISIRNTDLSIYYSSIGKASVRIVYLPFSDYQNIHGKLSRELNKIYHKTSQVLQEINTDDFITFNPSQQQSTQQIRHLFLDFLYELKFSNVFEYSPHYEKLLQVTRGNLLLNAIISKYEYDYWHKRSKSVQKENALEYAEVLEELEQTEKHWFSIIISEEANAIFESKWFENTPETEAVAINKNIKKRVKKELSEQQEETLTKVLQWFLNKYNLCDAYKTSRLFIGSLAYFIPILSLIAFVLCIGIFDSIFSFLFAEGLLIAFVIAIKMIPTVPFQKLFNHSFTSISLYSPKLIFSLIAAWSASSISFYAFDLEYNKHYYILFFPLFAVFIGYLRQTIRIDSPYLTLRHSFKRAIWVTCIMFLWSVIIGSMVLNITQKSKFTSDYTYKTYQKIIFDANLHISDTNLVKAIYQELPLKKQLKLCNLVFADTVQSETKKHPILPFSATALTPYFRYQKDSLNQLHLPDSLKREIPKIAITNIPEYDLESPIYLDNVKLYFCSMLKIPIRCSIGHLVLFPNSLLFYTISSIFFGIFIKHVMRGDRITGY